jgi:hypothetical protein
VNGRIIVDDLAQEKGRYDTARRLIRFREGERVTVSCHESHMIPCRVHILKIGEFELVVLVVETHFDHIKSVLFLVGCLGYSHFITNRRIHEETSLSLHP